MRILIAIGTFALLTAFFLYACHNEPNNKKSLNPSISTKAQFMSSSTKLDGLLQIWLEEQKTKSASESKAYDWDLDDQGRIGVLIGLHLGAKMPSVEGLQVLLVRGQIAGGYANVQALRTLAMHPAISRVEASVRMHPTSDLANRSISAFTETNSTCAPRIVPYVGPQLAPGKTATAHFAVFPAFHKIQGTSYMRGRPFMQFCGDSSCKTILKVDKKIAPHVSDYAYIQLKDLPKAWGPDPKPSTRTYAELVYTFTKSQEAIYVRITFDKTNSAPDCSFNFAISSDDFLVQGKSTKTIQVMGSHANYVRKKHGVTGKGVVVGVIDTGIDWCHRDFRDASGNTRILSLWDQILPTNSPPDVGNDKDTSNDYGVLYRKTKLDPVIKQECVQGMKKTTKVGIDTSGHGSHVAGIAAASGNGVAPEADIMFVKYRGTSLHIILAIDFLINEAKRLGKPIVINMSLSTELGPKDGTSLRELFVTNSIGPGRNIAASAGNNGSLRIHARGFVKQDETAEIKFTYPRGSRGQFVHLYTDPDDSYTLTLKQDNGSSNPLSLSRNQASTVGCTNKVIPGTSPVKRVYLCTGIRLERKIESVLGVERGQLLSPPGESKWILSLKRDKSSTGNGYFDAYVSKRYSGAAYFVSPLARNQNGSYQGVLGSPGSSPGALTVGSHNLRYSFDRPGGGWLYRTSFSEFGSLASSSSRGPTGDNRPGVDIVAPGRYIKSTRSIDILSSRDSGRVSTEYRATSGTSMSTPLVAGMAALLLQKDKTLFVRPLLKKYAHKPREKSCKTNTECDSKKCTNGSCEPDPNQWGAGLATMIGVFEALAKSKVPTVTLETKDKSLQRKSPVTLIAKSSDKISEYHWDVTGDGRVDEITTTGELTTHTAPNGDAKITVTAYNEEGKSGSKTILLTEKSPQQVSFQEIHVGTRGYIALKNHGTTSVDLSDYKIMARYPGFDGYGRFFQFIDFKIGDVSTQKVLIQPNQILYLMGGELCPKQATSNCINMKKSIRYLYNRTSYTYLCSKGCRLSTLVDLHVFGNEKRPQFCEFGARFGPTPSVILTSSTNNTKSYIRQAVKGSHPGYQLSDWKISDKTCVASCGGFCVNTKLDDKNCGTCGNQCTNGQVCLQGKCSACAQNSDCGGFGRVCSNGVCQVGNCRQASDCKKGQICKNNICSTCTQDKDCSSGQLCLNGTCKVGACRQTSDCKNGQVCKNNTCSPCTQNNECPNDQICKNKACSACTQDSECDSGKLCLNGACKVGNCRKTPDCKNGQICKNNACSACAQDSECNPAQLCLSGACKAGDCRQTSDCKKGQICKNNTCSACTQDSECDSGQTCINGICAIPEPASEPQPEPVIEEPFVSEPVRDASSDAAAPESEAPTHETSAPPPEDDGCKCSVSPSGKAPFDVGLFVMLFWVLLLVRRPS